MPRKNCRPSFGPVFSPCQRQWFASSDSSLVFSKITFIANASSFFSPAHWEFSRNFNLADFQSFDIRKWRSHEKRQTFSNNVCFKKTWTNHSSDTVLQIVQVFLNQTLVSHSYAIPNYAIFAATLFLNSPGHLLQKKNNLCHSDLRQVFWGHNDSVGRGSTVLTLGETFGSWSSQI